MGLGAYAGNWLVEFEERTSRELDEMLVARDRVPPPAPMPPPTPDGVSAVPLRAGSQRCIQLRFSRVHLHVDHLILARR